MHKDRPKPVLIPRRFWDAPGDLLAAVHRLLDACNALRALTRQGGSTLSLQAEVCVESDFTSSTYLQLMELSFQHGSVSRELVIFAFSVAIEVLKPGRPDFLARVKEQLGTVTQDEAGDILL